MKRIAIIGAGKGGYALLNLLLDVKSIKVVGIADKNKNAPALKLANHHNIFTAIDYNELLKIKNIDILINLTGSDTVSKDIQKRALKAELIEGMSAKLVWDILDKLKEEQEEISRNLSELKELYKIGVTLTSAHSLEEVLTAIVQKSTEFINCPAGSLALYDAGTGELKLAASKGLSPKFVEIDKWKVRPSGLTSYILNERRPVAIADIKNEPRLNNPIMIEEGIQALIAIPLLANSRIIGILYIDDFKPRAFTSNEISFLSLLGTQATFAIEKFQLLKELKEKNEALLEAKDYLKNVLDDSADVIMTTNLEGKIVEFNRGAEKILGYERDEVIDRLASELYLNKGERDKILDKMEREGSLSNYETQLVAKNGRVIDISLTISKLGNGMGKIIGTVGISKDITEEKRIRLEIDNKNNELKEVNDRLEERILERTIELERSNQRLERANKVKNQFIANMSHELRTPLNSIIGFSEILLSDTFGKVTEKQARYANNILTSGKHLLQLINNILDIAKIEAGKMTLDYSTFSALNIINEVMSIINPLADKKGVHLEVRLNEDLPQLTADTIKFKQILYNLLSNAIKFTHQDGRVSLVAEKVKNATFTNEEVIEARAVDQKEFVQISVMDNGIGIRPDDMDRIFEEFEQADSSYSRSHEGLGLGLALTKRLIELHGGTIWVESHVNKGSTFSFIIPTVARTPQTKSLSIDNTPLYTPSVSVEDITPAKPNAPLVLVVEDDKLTSELLSVYLLKSGYSVAHAYDGNDAIAKAQELKPFAITLDVMLPHKDGWEVLQILKRQEETKDIPVLINSIVDNKERGFILGAADYFIKPLDSVKLIERLNEFKPLIRRSRHSGNILLIDGDEGMVKHLTSILTDEGFEVLNTQDSEEGIELAIVGKPDLIIIDMMFNDSKKDVSGFDIIYKLRTTPITQGIPIFLLTATEMKSDERHQVMGYIDRIIQKSPFSKDTLIEQIKILEYLYPARAGLKDDVTGLFNHRYLNIRLAQEINKANRYKQPCSLLILTIDNLHTYVEKNGKFHGNVLLKKTAELIKKSLRGYDTAVRYGVDGLAVLLSNTPKSPAMHLAKRFKTIIESYPFYNTEIQPKGRISISIGLATYLDDVNSIEGLIAASHQALSDARNAGGDSIVTFNQ